MHLLLVATPTAAAGDDDRLVIGPIVTGATVDGVAFWGLATAPTQLRLRLTDNAGWSAECLSQPSSQCSKSLTWFVSTVKAPAAELTLTVTDLSGKVLTNRDGFVKPPTLEGDGRSLPTTTGPGTYRPLIAIGTPSQFTSSLLGAWRRVASTRYAFAIVSGRVSVVDASPAVGVQRAYEGLYKSDAFGEVAWRVPVVSVLRPFEYAPRESRREEGDWAEVVECFNGALPWKSDATRLFTEKRIGPFNFFMLDSMGDPNGPIPDGSETEGADGSVQLRWLQDVLPNCDAPFKVLCSDKSWDESSNQTAEPTLAWSAERRRLLDWLGSIKATGVILLSTGAKHTGLHEYASTQLGYKVMEVLIADKSRSIVGASCVAKECCFDAGPVETLVTVCAAEYGTVGARVEFRAGDNSLLYFTERSYWALRQ